MDVKVARGKIIITPQVAIDRWKFPTAEDKCSPAQRRIIGTRLAKAVTGVKEGHVSPAFETIAEFAASLKADAKKLKTKTKHRARR